MTASSQPAASAGASFLAQYDHALPQVYGYLLARGPDAAIAKDLTSETFLAAVDAIDRGTLPTPSVAWLIGVARHELDAHVAHDVLQRLGAHHRSALTLRYLDGLPVPEVADPFGHRCMLSQPINPA